MSHWRKSYPPTSQFNSFAGWMIGASMLVGALVFIAGRARLESGLDRRAGTSLRYPSREWDRRQPDQMKEARKPFWVSSCIRFG
jgi:hypothetical protein